MKVPLMGRGSGFSAQGATHANNPLDLVPYAVKVAFCLHLVILVVAGVVFYPLIGLYWLTGIATGLSLFWIFAINGYLTERANHERMIKQEEEIRKHKMETRRFTPRRAAEDIPQIGSQIGQSEPENPRQPPF
jgi:hypothetical protein